MKSTRTALLSVLSVAIFVCLPAVHAQTLDVFAGLNALTAKQAIQSLPKLGGGLFPSAGADLFLGPVGIGGEVSFRATTNSSGLRPTYYDFNVLLAPVHITRSIIPELMLGLGSQDIHGITGLASCGSLSNCSTYAGNHLAAHVGVAAKVFITEHIFLRPEAHFYFIHNNTAFPNAQRWGVSLGYSFGS
ncbi:MAG: hypothetical protein ACRD1C_12580 [Terriglobales bacterium]